MLLFFFSCPSCHRRQRCETGNCSSRRGLRLTATPTPPPTTRTPPSLERRRRGEQTASGTASESHWASKKDLRPRCLRSRSRPEEQPGDHPTRPSPSRRTRGRRSCVCGSAAGHSAAGVEQEGVRKPLRRLERRRRKVPCPAKMATMNSPIQS